MSDPLSRRFLAGGNLLAAALFGVSTAALAQTPAPITLAVPENSITKISEHVSAIVGNPNIAIIVGQRATLVVDTGMGPRTGAVVVKEAAKLAKSPKMFLTTTHYHPEHATGAEAFPENTVFVIPAVQQQEMNRRGQEFIDMFRANSATNKVLLQDLKLRAPDILFDRDATLDLGGVHARLMLLGPAHTQGDEVIFVEEDGVLIPGDLVQNKIMPSLFNEDASAIGWLAALDKIAMLNVRQVVPDHGKLGDGALVASEKAFLTEFQRRVLELKRSRTSEDDAAKTLIAEFKAKYPDWTGFDGGIPRGVKRIYAESQ